MSFKKAALCAFAAVALLTGAGCEQKPASPPPSPDEVRAKYTADIQQTLTAYFNTHGLKASQLQRLERLGRVESRRGRSWIFGCHRRNIGQGLPGVESVILRTLRQVFQPRRREAGDLPLI